MLVSGSRKGEALLSDCRTLVLNGLAATRSPTAAYVQRSLVVSGCNVPSGGATVTQLGVPLTEDWIPVQPTDLIHVFIGTKAQYIKTAPLLRELDGADVPYRLIDSGQHAELSGRLRKELGIRNPDVVLGGERDVESIPHALRWAFTIAVRLWSRSRIQREIFGQRGGICVVHGDTPSTLLSAIMAKRAGLDVAHLEAGLRSDDLFNPFPEELIRVAVMRMSDVLYAPDHTAVQNLARMRRLRGDVVHLSGNTVLEALAYSLDGSQITGSGPVMMTMHRVENLHSTRRVNGFVSLALRCAERWPVRLVLHGPTREALARTGLLARLQEAPVELSSLVPHQDFTTMLARAPFVVTDGGSIQEECALLGVPTLLWRERSERPDGIGENVVISGYRKEAVDTFLERFEELRRGPAALGARPSHQILEDLLARLRSSHTRR